MQKTILRTILYFFLLGYTVSASGNDLQFSTALRGFEENRGQVKEADREILFRINTTGLKAYITSSGISYFFLQQQGDSVHWERVDMQLKGACILSENITREEEEPGTVNYYLPQSPSGINEVKRYRKLYIKNIYPGIDWILKDQHEMGFTYDFIVHPGADPSSIIMNYNGAKELLQDAPSELRIRASLGELREGKLQCFAGDKVIASSYLLNGTQVRFDIPAHDPSKELLIDPPLIWSTYYGGAGGNDQGRSITTDLKGNLYVRGFSNSTNLPLKNSAGAYNQGMLVSNQDMFVLKFDSNGTLLWGTFYGGSLSEASYLDRDEHGIAFDEVTQSLYVVAATQSPDFPVFDPAGNTNYYQGTNAGAWDGFILKFSASGARLWATYYGGSLNDYSMAVETDANGNAFVVGYTNSTNLALLDPGNGAYYQGTLTPLSLGLFILKFDKNAQAKWMTLYAGLSSTNGHGMCVDKFGNLYIVGITNAANFPTLLHAAVGTYYQPNNAGNYDAFILKFDTLGRRKWATNYGGSGFDRASSVSTDDDGNVYVTGATASTDFPLMNLAGAFNQGLNGGGYDIFILKFDSATVRKWATYYGGLLDDSDGGQSTGPSIKAFKNKTVYVAGKTASLNLKTLNNPETCVYYDGSHNGKTDMFLAEFSPVGVQKWGTFIGGSEDDHAAAITTDFRGNLYLTGLSNSPNFPTRDPQTAAYYQPVPSAANQEAIIMKFGDPLLIADFTHT